MGPALRPEALQRLFPGREAPLTIPERAHPLPLGIEQLAVACQGVVVARFVVKVAPQVFDRQRELLLLDGLFGPLAQGTGLTLDLEGVYEVDGGRQNAHRNHQGQNKLEIQLSSVHECSG